MHIEKTIKNCSMNPSATGSEVPHQDNWRPQHSRPPTAVLMNQTRKSKRIPHQPTRPCHYPTCKYKCVMRHNISEKGIINKHRSTGTWSSITTSHPKPKPSLFLSIFHILSFGIIHFAGSRHYNLMSFLKITTNMQYHPYCLPPSPCSFQTFENTDGKSI